jgi:hypothetical protein
MTKDDLKLVFAGRWWPSEAEAVQKSNPAVRTRREALTAALSYSAFRHGDGVQSVLLHCQIRHTTNRWLH